MESILLRITPREQRQTRRIDAPRLTHFESRSYHLLELFLTSGECHSMAAGATTTSAFKAEDRWLRAVETMLRRVPMLETRLIKGERKLVWRLRPSL